MLNFGIYILLQLRGQCGANSISIVEIVQNDYYMQYVFFFAATLYVWTNFSKTCKIGLDTAEDEPSDPFFKWKDLGES